MFGWFKSPQQKALDLLGQMYGVITKGMEPMSEASEWLEDLNERDPRRKRIPKGFLNDDYFVISRQRKTGVVFRVTETDVEVRVPFELQLPGNVKVPHSHLLRRLPIRALLALKQQRAQKVIENLVEDAQEIFQTHHKTCKVCFERFAPTRYPGHPNEGVLGPPARKFFICESCIAKAAHKEDAQA